MVIDMACKFEMLSFKENDERRLHFLTALDEALVVPFHWDYANKIDVVCDLYRGQSHCKFCIAPTEGMKCRERFAFYVYDMDKESVGIIATLDSGNALLPVLCDLDEEVGDIKGNSFLIDRTGYAKDSVFFGTPIDDHPGDISELAEVTEENLKLNVIDFWDNLRARN